MMTKKRSTHHQAYFVSESTVYRLLKIQDLITSPAYILTLPISRSSVGAGITYLRCWMTTPDSSLPGGYAHR